MNILKQKVCLLILLGMLGCQRDKDVTPKAIRLLEGKWEQTGHQTTQDGKEVWVADTTNGKVSLTFRADGVPLDENGEGLCCSPQNFLLNGKLYPIEPKSPVKPADYCALVNCASCGTVELQATENTLLWISCGGYKITYRKLP
ncbi:hypothetical protein [Persicitalea jodogahamensis]|uniref:Lipoprotein n=1 Tax=Persicitalea jodogahamensis TaxID=402147 RepID=A0A8J3D036_9BACT|nr:hypothetical protein [Persicitalea jodogahamensis]GHB54791.1 hypothetical protein GCM10007390_04890 [Persicitalea jodogahamensis]